VPFVSNWKIVEKWIQMPTLNHHTNSTMMVVESWVKKYWDGNEDVCSPIFNINKGCISHLKKQVQQDAAA
jgi:hypothetical protein